MKKKGFELEEKHPEIRPRIKSGEEDLILQTAVFFLLQKSNVQADVAEIKKHTENIIMIKLGRMYHKKTLTFDKYKEMKVAHRARMREMIKNQEIDAYDQNSDSYGKLDTVMRRQSLKISIRGPKAQREEENALIRSQVAKLMQDNKVSITEGDFKYNNERIVMIRLGKLLQAGTLTLKRYNKMKEDHIEEMKSAIRNREIGSYDFAADIFTKLDIEMGVEGVLTSASEGKPRQKKSRYHRSK